MLLIITTFFTSCKKSQQENSINSDKVFFYENSPNNTDGLIAEVQLSKENANAFIYGTSDSTGSPAHIKSMVYKINNNDTVYNFVFDNLNRVKIVYAKLNNNNLNQLIKFDYLTNDTVVTNIYKYNWITQTDSLLYQFKGKGSDQTKTYGARFSLSNLFKGDANAIVTAFIIVGLVYAGLPTAIYAAGVWITGSTTAGIFGGALTAITLVASTSGAQEYQPIKNPAAPISPTSASAIIPNPVGTPTNPVGSTGKVLYYALSCYSGCTGSSGVGTQIRVEIANVNHEIIASGTATVRDYTSPIPTNCDAGQPGDLILTLPTGGYYTTIYIGSNVAYYSNVYITEDGCNIVSL